MITPEIIFHIEKFNRMSPQAILRRSMRRRRILVEAHKLADTLDLRFQHASSQADFTPGLFRGAEQWCHCWRHDDFRNSHVGPQLGGVARQRIGFPHPQGRGVDDDIKVLRIGLGDENTASGISC
jgi:hypothetical protein